MVGMFPGGAVRSVRRSRQAAQVSGAGGRRSRPYRYSRQYAAAGAQAAGR